MRRGRLWLLCAVWLAFGLIVSWPDYSMAQYKHLPRNYLHQVTADFAVGAGHPLIKTKFNVFNFGSIEQFDRSLELLTELNPETYRFVFDWGSRYSSHGVSKSVGGTTDNLKYDFTALDHIVGKLYQRDIRLIGCYGFTPFPLQNPAVKDNPQMAPPVDLNKFKEVVSTFAKHYRDLGMSFAAHEIWNEPDIRQFFTGTEADYQKLYAAAAEAIRAVDPDAAIGGPSAAEYLFYESFPDFVRKNNLPLDVLIYHHYGSPALRETDAVARSLARYPYFNTTEMSMDEYQSADCCDWCRDDIRSRYEGASQLLRDFQVFLTRPELTSVSWAWFQDPPNAPPTGCMGLVTADGHRKAIFNAFKIYARMPVDRKQVSVVGPLEAMASADDHKASLVIWNPDSYERRLDVNLNNIRFAKGNVRVYRIDKNHASWGDGSGQELEPVETYMNVDTARWTWRGAIPRQGTIYFEADDGSGLSELTPAKVAKVVRVHHYYPARGTTSYHDFDRKTWIARLGMVNEQSADEEVGVTAEELPVTLDITTKVDGKLQKLNTNSLLGVRLDYVAGGSYTKGVLFHGPYDGVDLYDPARSAAMPWGTKRPADQAVAVGNLASFQIRPKEYAPANWGGRAQVTLIMQNSGPDTRAKFMVRGK